MTKFISEECYNDIMEMAAQMVAEAVINELNNETVQSAANKLAYKGGYHGSLQFNYGIKTPTGKKALKRFSKMKDLLKNSNYNVNRNEIQDSHNKGWEAAKN